jgi:hypothetical protein
MSRVPPAGRAAAMTAHHDRVRTVLVVHELEANRRYADGEGAQDIAALAARVARIQSRFDEIRVSAAEWDVSDRRDVDTGATAAEWMLAVYDAALVELCTALGVEHSLVDEAVCSEDERQRVELFFSLLSLVPTYW